MKKKKNTKICRICEMCFLEKEKIFVRIENSCISSSFFFLCRRKYNKIYNSFEPEEINITVKCTSNFILISIKKFLA